MKKDEQIKKLVKDLVDVALINNKVLAGASFKKDSIDDLKLAVEMNNEVLRIYTNIEELGKEDEEQTDS